MLRLPEYEAHRNFSSGCANHSHIGQMTDTIVDFECRGGMLIISLRMSPCVTASRCSQIVSMCQLSTNFTPGSTTCHDCFTNSYNDALAARRCFSFRTKSSMTAGCTGAFIGSPSPHASVAAFRCFLKQLHHAFQLTVFEVLQVDRRHRDWTTVFASVFLRDLVAVFFWLELAEQPLA